MQSSLPKKRVAEEAKALMMNHLLAIGPGLGDGLPSIGASQKLGLITETGPDFAGKDRWWSPLTRAHHRNVA